MSYLPGTQTLTLLDKRRGFASVRNLRGQGRGAELSMAGTAIASERPCFAGAANLTRARAKPLAIVQTFRCINVLMYARVRLPVPGEMA